MNEVERVGAFVVAMFASLFTPYNFFVASLLPENLIFSFDELPLFFQFSGFIFDKVNNLV